MVDVVAGHSVDAVARLPASSLWQHTHARRILSNGFDAKIQFACNRQAALCRSCLPSPALKFATLICNSIAHGRLETAGLHCCAVLVVSNRTSCGVLSYRCASQMSQPQATATAAGSTTAAKQTPTVLITGCSRYAAFCVLHRAIAIALTLVPCTCSNVWRIVRYSGLGNALVDHFLGKKNYRVIATVRSLATQPVFHQCTKTPVPTDMLKIVEMDVTNPQSIQSCLTSIKQLGWGVDILVHSAAIVDRHYPDETALNAKPKTMADAYAVCASLSQSEPALRLTPVSA